MEGIARSADDGMAEDDDDEEVDEEEVLENEYHERAAMGTAGPGR